MSVLSPFLCHPSLVSRTKCCRVWQQTFVLAVFLMLSHQFARCSSYCEGSRLVHVFQSYIHTLLIQPLYKPAFSHIPGDGHLKSLSVVNFRHLLELGAHLQFFLSKMKFTRPSKSTVRCHTYDREARVLSVFCLSFSVQGSVWYTLDTQ